MPTHEPPRRRWALGSVSNSVRHRRIRKPEKIRGLCESPPEEDRTSDPQIDPPSAEKRTIYEWKLTRLSYDILVLLVKEILGSYTIYGISLRSVTIHIVNSAFEVAISNLVSYQDS